jgi:hypothetical protein
MKGRGTFFDGEMGAVGMSVCTDTPELVPQKSSLPSAMNTHNMFDPSFFSTVNPQTHILKKEKKNMPKKKKKLFLHKSTRRSLKHRMTSPQSRSTLLIGSAHPPLIPIGSPVNTKPIPLPIPLQKTPQLPPPRTANLPPDSFLPTAWALRHRSSLPFHLMLCLTAGYSHSPFHSRIKTSVDLSLFRWLFAVRSSAEAFAATGAYWISRHATIRSFDQNCCPFECRRHSATGAYFAVKD